MKADVLTLAAVVFVVGLLMSSISVSEIFQPDAEQAAMAQQEENKLR